jgi:hypothetical protein
MVERQAASRMISQSVKGLSCVRDFIVGGQPAQPSAVLVLAGLCVDGLSACRYQFVDLTENSEPEVGCQALAQSELAHD